MAGFHYSFQRIVDLKGSEKTQAEWQLSSAIGALTAEEKLLSELQQQRHMWEQKLLTCSEQAVPLSELQTIQQYIDYLIACISNKMSDVGKAQRAVDTCREQLADRMKDEKVWVKAKEKAFDKFRYALQMKEQNELDEMASVRFMLPTQ